VRRRQNWDIWRRCAAAGAGASARNIRRSARSTRPRLPGGSSPSVTAVAGFTPDAGRVPSAARHAGPVAPGTGRSGASNWSHYPAATCPEPRPVPGADSVPAASEAADRAASMELSWPADAVANAKRTWPRHNSTSADMHGTAIPERADHLLAASPATGLSDGPVRLDKTPGHDPNRAPLRNRTVDLLLTIHTSLGSLPGNRFPQAAGKR